MQCLLIGTFMKPTNFHLATITQTRSMDGLNRPCSFQYSDVYLKCLKW